MNKMVTIERMYLYYLDDHYGDVLMLMEMPTDTPLPLVGDHVELCYGRCDVTGVVTKRVYKFGHPDDTSNLYNPALFVDIHVKVDLE